MFINSIHFVKYFTQLIFVSIASYLLSPCNIEYQLAITIGLISSTIFVLLDNQYPYIIQSYNSPSNDGLK